MSIIRTSVSVALASLVCAMVCVTGAAAADQDPLGRAKDLYRTAAYDEALGVLNSIPANSTSANPTEVNEYKVFCLLALDRNEEARQAITALVTANPSYQLSESEASPRVRAVFKEVRQSVLPSLVRRAYADAKAAFDHNDPRATAAFENVLTLLHDPDLAGNAEFADMVTVVGAFRDLSKARAAAATAPVPSRPAFAPPPRVAASANAGGAPAARPAEPRVYRDGEAPNIVPPVTISQAMPPAVLPDKRLWTGSLELLIDDHGNVASARMTAPINSSYDKQLLQAASQWKYKPATKDGKPVSYVKVISVRIDTRPPCTDVATLQCRPGTE